MELSKSDLQAIESLRFEIEKAIINGNADHIADLCTDDVQLLHPDTPLITGKKALRDHEAEILKMVHVIYLKLSPVLIEGNGALAYEIGTQELEIEPSDERFLGKRKYVHILKKGEDGQWLFSVLMSNNG